VHTGAQLWSIGRKEGGKGGELDYTIWVLPAMVRAAVCLVRVSTARVDTRKCQQPASANASLLLAFKFYGDLFRFLSLISLPPLLAGTQPTDTPTEPQASYAKS
jgi:hypothetical protein